MGRVCVVGLQLMAVGDAGSVVLRSCNSVPTDATPGNKFGDRPVLGGNPVNSVCS